MEVSHLKIFLLEGVIPVAAELIADTEHDYVVSYPLRLVANPDPRNPSNINVMATDLCIFGGNVDSIAIKKSKIITVYDPDKTAQDIYTQAVVQIRARKTGILTASGSDISKLTKSIS